MADWFVGVLIWVGVGRRGSACRGGGGGVVFVMLSSLICLSDCNIRLP